MQVSMPDAAAKRAPSAASGQQRRTVGTSALGFGLFLAVNMLSTGGGTFPLLPVAFQTFDVMFPFYLAQALCLVTTLFAGALVAYRWPRCFTHRTTVLCGPIACLGSLCLIAPLYLPRFTPWLVPVGGALLGVGSGLFMLFWQRLFASRDFAEGMLGIVLGMACAAPLYVLLSAMPSAVAAFVAALVAIPLAEVLLIDGSRTMDLDQPMFEDEPRAHANVYRHALNVHWRSALCVGCFAFTGGIARAVTVENPAVGHLVNTASMAGVLVAAVALVLLWRRKTLRFNTVLVFRTLFPAVVSTFVALPYLGEAYLRGFAGVAYAVFTFGLMVLMAQCAQTSHEAGVHPVVLYGCFAGIVFALQAVGFVVGYLSPHVFADRALQLTTMALSSVWVLALAMYLVRGHLDPNSPHTRSVEFIALDPASASETGPAVPATPIARGAPEGVSQRDAWLGETDKNAPYRDRVSKKCDVLAQRYLLTIREGEILELIARGNTVPRMAETLVISENTVKTYCRRLYAKLGVHKRSEALDLLEELG